jgi:Ca-activated chloride channel homolog
MLNVSLTPHREFIPADSPEQKLFLMLKLRPTKEVASIPVSTTFVFIIDTSGSMYEVITGKVESTGRTIFSDGNEYTEVTGGKTKIDIAIESLLNLIYSQRLNPSDRIALIRFDDHASTVIGLTSATEVSKLEDAVHKLRHFSGGTNMGLGMRQALDILSQESMTIRRALIFTDGQTIDDDLCQELAEEFAASNIPITALGVGEDFNEDLLSHLSDTTGGSQFYIVPENPIGTQVGITELPQTILDEFTQAQQEVVNNLALSVKTVQGVKLTRVVRAYPSVSEFYLTQQPYPIGNASSNDETTFILEFTIESRPASKVRIAQLGLTYDVPGQNRRGELPLQNIVVQFVTRQTTAQVDQEVMGYIQQCNIAQMIKDATKIAEENPERAEEILEIASRMTVRLGNEEMSKSLENAQDELRKTRKLSSGTRKTVKMGSKGKTVKMGAEPNDELSEEQIREISGT